MMQCWWWWTIIIWWGPMLILYTRVDAAFGCWILTLTLSFDARAARYRLLRSWLKSVWTDQRTEGQSSLFDGLVLKIYDGSEKEKDWGGNWTNFPSLPNCQGKESNLLICLVSQMHPAPILHSEKVKQRPSKNIFVKFRVWGVALGNG